MRLLILVAALLTSCSAREPSSTDNHNRVPQASCTLVIYGGQMRNLCCDPEGRCVFEH